MHDSSNLQKSLVFFSDGRRFKTSSDSLKMRIPARFRRLPSDDGSGRRNIDRRPGKEVRRGATGWDRAGLPFGAPPDCVSTEEDYMKLSKSIKVALSCIAMMAMPTAAFAMPTYTGPTYTGLTNIQVVVAFRSG